MQAKTIRNIIIAALLVFIGVFVVYCTNTKDSKTEQAINNIKKNDNQEIRTESIIESQHNKQDNTQIDVEMQKETTNKLDSQIHPTETKDTQNTQTNNKSHDKMQTKTLGDKQTGGNHTIKKQDKKNQKKVNDIREKEKDAVGQTNNVIKNNTQQKSLESNQTQQPQDIQALTQENRNSKENKKTSKNNLVNGIGAISNNTSKVGEVEEQKDYETIHTNSENNAKEQDKQDKNNIESAKSSENDGNTTEQNSIESSKDESTSDRDNQTKTDKPTRACIVAPSCDNPDISRQLATTSLDLHANVRAKEEEQMKGQSAGKEFMHLWNQTRDKILPKLISHVSNIYDQGIRANKQIRTCVANYYTEVLEDFGHGWKDKKGDKSPIYKVKYSVSCRNLDAAKLTILEESEQNSKQVSQTLIRQDNKEVQQRRIPPECNDIAVYNQLAEAGLYAHAMARAQEEGRTRGQAAQQKFMQLWDKTQSQVISKLTAHVSNIYDQGIQANKQIRTCVANYYTEVLEDFGHGWKDKKGDKSPLYIVYYSVSYVNNEDDVIKIKITAQNRIK